MRISQLAERLAEAQEQYGDVEVVIYVKGQPISVKSDIRLLLTPSHVSKHGYFLPDGIYGRKKDVETGRELQGRSRLFIGDLRESDVERNLTIYARRDAERQARRNSRRENRTVTKPRRRRARQSS